MLHVPHGVMIAVPDYCIPVIRVPHYGCQEGGRQQQASVYDVIKVNLVVLALLLLGLVFGGGLGSLALLGLGGV